MKPMKKVKGFVLELPGQTAAGEKGIVFIGPGDTMPLGYV
jgi:hypothetical protein